MRRFQIPNAALVAGLAVLLSGCSGETPTAPSSNGGNGSGNGPCTTVISLSAFTVNPITASPVRATVTKAGVPVPDGTSVQFTTDLGFFEEIGLQTISKQIIDGIADVTVFSSSPGTAHVIAVFDCARAQLNLQFTGTPAVGPFISSVSPTTGSCAGGDTVTILGGRFDGTIDVRFGGASGSIVSATATQIVVKSPAHALQNPAVPETVQLVVIAGGAQTAPASFTFVGIDPLQKVFISSISPTAGTPTGGDTVLINGGHFGVNTAATQVTFCDRPAQIITQTEQQMTVTTPAGQLADPALSKACDVVVKRDIGLCSQQSATSPQQFTYRGSGGNAACNTDPTFFISSIAPNSGGPDGGTAVTITGGGFGSNASLLRVDFGGVPATIVGNISNTTISVSTPRHTLASPDVPETVDVVVTDLGSPTQRCARAASGFVYTAAALDPTIYSVSPRTGPNDATTRVSIFGTGFQFPMQVFMTGGSNCGAQLVEAAVSDISLKTIVFKTPIATNNVCLLNQLVDIVIVNPSTGKTASCPACFKYYSCPTVGGASPSVSNGTVSTTVVISGANFEEPITANFNVLSRVVPLNVTSVSSNAIVLTIPPLSQVLGGTPACGDVAGTINITFLSLTCVLPPVPFTYRIDPPVATSAAPNNLNQDGSAFPGPPATPVTVTVTGSNFTDPMTVQLIKDGTPVSNTLINNATVANATTLTFLAPAVQNSDLNKQNCGLGGTKDVATSFGIRLKSARTDCKVDLPNVLVYNPSDTTCRAALTITTASLPAGTATVAYGPVIMAAVGGTSTGYTWSAVGLPAALVINPLTGVISGIPAVAATSTVTVTVTDSAANTASLVYSLVINP